MLIDRTTIPRWVAEAAKLPDYIFGPRDDAEGADFSYCIRTVMLEDIEWQQDLELTVDAPLLIERKWYRVWFKEQNGFNIYLPSDLRDRSILAFRMRCIYRRLQKNGDVRKEYVRIMIRALEV